MFLLCAARKPTICCASSLLAALPGGNGTPMRTGVRVPKKRADSLCYFRGEDVLELARLLFDFVLVLQLQGLGEETLCKTVTPNDILSTLLPGGSKVDDELAVAVRVRRRMDGRVAAVKNVVVAVVRCTMSPFTHQSQLFHTIYCQRYGKRSIHLHAPDLCQLAVLVQRPDLLEDFVELHLVGHGEDLLVSDVSVMQLHW